MIQDIQDKFRRSNQVDEAGRAGKPRNKKQYKDADDMDGGIMTEMQPQRRRK